MHQAVPRIQNQGGGNVGQTDMMTTESPPEVSVINPKRKMKMVRCQNVFSDSVMR